MIGSIRAQSSETFELYNELKGLSNNWVSHISFDSSGFLWVGTRDGLNRFDGYKFKVFRHNKSDSTSLLHDYGQNLYVDQDGIIWIAYHEGGISTFHPLTQKFSHFSNEKTQISKAIDDEFKILHKDKKGRIWYSGYNLGLKIYHPQTNEFLQVHLTSGTDNGNIPIRPELNMVQFVHDLGNGNYWLCTKNGLYKWNEQDLSLLHVFQHKRHKSCNKLIYDSDSTMWLSFEENAISWFDPKSGKSRDYLIDSIQQGHFNLSFDLQIKSEDEFWVASGDRGLLVFNKLTGKYSLDPLLNLDSKACFITKILLGRNGEIILSDEIGFYKYSPFNRLFQFKRLPIKSSQHGELFNIFKILENPQRNEIYFATFMGNGLNVLNTNTNELYALSVETNQSIDHKVLLKDLVLDADGKYWLLTRDYLYQFLPERRKLRRIKNFYSDHRPETSNTFKSFIQDSSLSIFVLTENGTLFQWNTRSEKLNELTLIHTDSQNKPMRISNACISPDHRRWVSSDTKLAYFTESDHRLNYIPIDHILTAKEAKIVGVSSDANSNLWLAVNNIGLVKISMKKDGPPEIRVIGVNEGLTTPIISRMALDQRNNLWLSTYKGILKYDIEKNRFMQFKQNVGIDRYNLLVRYSNAGQGSFYMSAPGQYCKVNYELFDHQLTKPTVYLDEMSTNAGSVSLSDSLPGLLVIRSGVEYFSIEFGCLDYANQDYHQFAYQLVNRDKEWHYIINQRFAHFANVPAGRYSFHVKVANVGGVWSDPIKLDILVEAPFYQHNWFKISVLFFLTGLIFGIYQWRIFQVRRTESLKAEFNKQVEESKMAALRAQMNPHFIFNCLNSINRYIIKSDLKKSSLYLTKFARLIRIILDNSAHQLVSLESELESLKLYIELEQLRFDHKFVYQVSVSPDVPCEFIEIPPLLLQPYVENAIWHGLLPKEADAKLHIDLYLSEPYLIIEITDNGIGRQASAQQKQQMNSTRKSLGMKLTEERLRYINNGETITGSQEIIDLLDEDNMSLGTKVIIRIPYSAS
ncbi:MAG: histidine kinase [Saprospiraceae bacterium]|nr:histidine kinase [Saprospiraceae bacterium]